MLLRLQLRYLMVCLLLWCGHGVALAADCLDQETWAAIQHAQWDHARVRLQAMVDQSVVVRGNLERWICLRRMLGNAQAQLMQLEAATDNLQLAYNEALLQLGPEHPETMNAAMGLAIVHGKRGEHDKALPVLRALLPPTERRYGANAMQVLTLLKSTATSLAWIGNYADALPLDERVLRIAEQLKPDGDVGGCQSVALCERIKGNAAKNLALTLTRLGRAPQGLPLAERGVALQMAHLGPSHPNVLDAQLVLASALIGVGQIQEAHELQEKVRNQAQAALGSTHPITLKAEGDLAASSTGREALVQSKSPQQARLQVLRETLGPSHPDVLLASVNLVDTLTKLGEFAPALEAAEAAVQGLLQRTDTLMFDDRSQRAWLNQQYKLEWLYLGLLVRNGRVPDAFLASETLKHHRYALQLGASGETALGSARAQTSKEALRQLTLLDQRIALARSLNQSVSVLLADRSAAFDRWNASRASTPFTLPNVKAVPAWAQTVVKHGDAVISYRVIGGSLCAFVLEGDKVSFVRLADADRVMPTIEAYRLTMRQIAMSGKPYDKDVLLPLWRLPNGSFRYASQQPPGVATRAGGLNEVLQSLSEWLIQPLLPKLGTHSGRLLVSVDGSLGHVPFESLPMESGQGEPKILGERFAVSLLPSFVMFDTLQARQRAYADLDRRPLMAVGGAHYAKVERHGFISIQRERNVRAMQPMDLKQMWQSAKHDRSLLPLAYLNWSQGFSDLPGSAEEVDELAGLFGEQPSRRSLVLKGASASEATINRLDQSGDLADYRILHFSTHGFLSDDEPALSAVVLKQVNREPGTDGYLTAAELSTLALRSDLVVVSACDSGASHVTVGDGATGLSMALFQAGTVSSILSLWPIEDEASRRFMVHFYQLMANGLDAGQSLRQTRLWARDRGLSRHVSEGLVRWGL
ncbi:MAG: CHAT domain-containing protein [Aquabacterium sp.]|uniref:CHAT domain-containing tetratricopeptide repeat protein n=1 Tax=Aquabacterium sp. TaxID=1872578 RepID=UPI0025BBB8AA|nr:CHAT domain-containing tetratricopeptide repeat protein [Aquabacterium sp.]MBI5924093.1 CHAT domain-containing protein [Aquabacterium sp.]